MYPRYVGDDRGDEYKKKVLNEKYTNIFKNSEIIGEINIYRNNWHIYPYTFSYLDGTYGLMNEFGVTIGESTCGSKLISSPIYDNGKALLEISELTRIALEHSTTAKEAIKLIGKLSERYGYYGSVWDINDIDSAREESGEALIISDPFEVWIFHIVPDDTGTSSVWIAKRLPDNHITSITNGFIIRNVPIKKTLTCIYSDNIFIVAKRSKIWDPNIDKELDFTKHYGQKLTDFRDPYVSRRRWRIFTLTTDINLSSTSNTLDQPFSYHVKELVDITILRKIFRDHFENTPYDTTIGPLSGPYGNPNRYDTYDSLSKDKNTKLRNAVIDKLLKISKCQSDNNTNNTNIVYESTIHSLLYKSPNIKDLLSKCNIKDDIDIDINEKRLIDMSFGSPLSNDELSNMILERTISLFRTSYSVIYKILPTYDTIISHIKEILLNKIIIDKEYFTSIYNIILSTENYIGKILKDINNNINDKENLLYIYKLFKEKKIKCDKYSTYYRNHEDIINEQKGLHIDDDTIVWHQKIYNILNPMLYKDINKLKINNKNIYDKLQVRLKEWNEQWNELQDINLYLLQQYIELYSTISKIYSDTNVTNDGNNNTIIYLKNNQKLWDTYKYSNKEIINIINKCKVDTICTKPLKYSLQSITAYTMYYSPHQAKTSIYVPLFVKPLDIDIPSLITNSIPFEFSFNSLWWVIASTSNHIQIAWRYMIRDLEITQNNLDKYIDNELDRFNNDLQEIYAVNKQNDTTNILQDTNIFLETISNHVYNIWWDLYWKLVTKYRDGYIFGEYNATTWDMYSMFYPTWWLQIVRAWRILPQESAYSKQVDSNSYPPPYDICTLPTIQSITKDIIPVPYTTIKFPNFIINTVSNIKYNTVLVFIYPYLKYIGISILSLLLGYFLGRYRVFKKMSSNGYSYNIFRSSNTGSGRNQETEPLITKSVPVHTYTAIGS